jgi:hypothetical protein
LAGRSNFYGLGRDTETKLRPVMAKYHPITVAAIGEIASRIALGAKMDSGAFHRDRDRFVWVFLVVCNAFSFSNTLPSSTPA